MNLNLCGPGGRRIRPTSRMRDFFLIHDCWFAVTAVVKTRRQNYSNRKVRSNEEKQRKISTHRTQKGQHSGSRSKGKVKTKMAAAGKRTVYVFSVIPRLARLIQDKLPDVDVLEVKHKGKAALFTCI